MNSTNLLRASHSSIQQIIIKSWINYPANFFNHKNKTLIWKYCSTHLFEKLEKNKNWTTMPCFTKIHSKITSLTKIGEVIKQWYPTFDTYSNHLPHTTASTRLNLNWASKGCALKIFKRGGAYVKFTQGLSKENCLRIGPCEDGMVGIERLVWIFLCVEKRFHAYAVP